jgi:hypothetical protein
MPRDKRPSVKDERRYEAMRREGMSKEKAARIANTDPKVAGRRGGKAAEYEEWSKDDLYDKAKKVGIEGRSKMSKRQLISALRNHQSISTAGRGGAQARAKILASVARTRHRCPTR